jgi:ribosomal protein S12 methylthiotransferase accessory factor
MSTRAELRKESAEALNAIPRDKLLKEFGISRLAYLSNLDSIGVPVYSSVRALSKTVSIHAGKSLDKDLARAGAIAEAIEFEVAENPVGEFKIASQYQIPEHERLSITDCFPCRSSIVNDATLLTWEKMVNIQNGETKLAPSDIIWMISRMREQPISYFQSSSNGLASGASLEDAVLSGLYEIIERDGWTLYQYLLDTFGIAPSRVPLISLPSPLDDLIDRIQTAGLRVHIFDCTNDYRVPVFGSIILDTNGDGAGTFSGYGSNLDAVVAATRSVLESIQGRACYISGARDDLLRRQFLLMKRLDQEKLDGMFLKLPLGNPIGEYRKIEFPDVKGELHYLLHFLKRYGVSEVYTKSMGVHAGLHVVRVFSPQCEPCRFDHWIPSLRCTSYGRRCIERLSDSKGKTVPQTAPPQEGESWKES